MALSIKIAPSILSADFARLADAVLAAEAAGADYVHVDVMDGHFVPNITVGPLIVEALRCVTCLPLHVHLMISEPERYLASFAHAGASLLTVHVETCPHLHRTVGQIRELGVQPGVTLNPATPTLVLRDIVGDVDQVLVMTVNPGFGGQAFIPRSLTRIAEVRQMVSEVESEIEIAVDGGIGPDTAAAVVRAGANVLVAGSAIFRSPAGIGASMTALRNAGGGSC